MCHWVNIPVLHTDAKSQFLSKKNQFWWNLLQYWIWIFPPKMGLLRTWFLNKNWDFATVCAMRLLLGGGQVQPFFRKKYILIFWLHFFSSNFRRIIKIVNASIWNWLCNVAMQMRIFTIALILYSYAYLATFEEASSSENYFEKYQHPVNIWILWPIFERSERPPEASHRLP